MPPPEVVSSWGSVCFTGCHRCLHSSCICLSVCLSVSPSIHPSSQVVCELVSHPSFHPDRRLSSLCLPVRPSRCSPTPPCSGMPEPALPSSQEPGTNCTPFPTPCSAMSRWWSEICHAENSHPGKPTKQGPTCWRKCILNIYWDGVASIRPPVARVLFIHLIAHLPIHVPRSAVLRLSLSICSPSRLSVCLSIHSSLC